MTPPPVIGITTRVEVIQSYSERRDCLDQRWFEFARQLGATAVALPNRPAEEVAELLDALNCRLIILSGGNSLTALTPDAPDAAPERDQFEAALLEECQSRGLPVIGVCRGLQMINSWAGGTLSPIEGHAGTRHSLRSASAAPEFPTDVNSYHNWAIAPGQLADSLIPLAWDSDGNIEALQHSSSAIQAIMWHPERESSPHPADLRLFSAALTAGAPQAKASSSDTATKD